MDPENASTKSRAPLAGNFRPAVPSNEHTWHQVKFYEEDHHLIETVGDFLEAGFENGETAVIVATAGHRDILENRLLLAGRNPAALEAGGQLIVMDAEETLRLFLVDGWPDEALFREKVGGPILRSLATRRRGLRAFGEMVALLWMRGLDSAAIRLEQLWNDLGHTCKFSLLCAYPMTGFRGAGRSGAAFATICREHDLVIPADQDSLRLAAIVESSFDGIVSKDLDGTITSWNRAAEAIFGHTSAEAVGRHISMLIPSHLLGDETRIIQRIRSGERVEPFETVRIHKDGHFVDVSLTVSPVRDWNGTIIGASKIVRDITESKKYQAALAEKEEQLRQSQKMEAVGRLAGGIAHDFNNLLTAINGYSEMALGMASEGEMLHEFLLEIRKSGERAASLTQQLLAYSRKQILAPTVFDMNAAVADMDRMLRRLIGEDIEILTSLDPGLEKVKADPGQVQQIILNLVLNARDAMPQGGRLILETSNRWPETAPDGPRLESASGRHVILSVTDTGIGMEQGVKARIFEPFFTTKEVGKGTGLGLSSVYGILKQSGGGIQVESEPGRGSTFRVFLPRAAPGEASKPAGGNPALNRTGRRSETILLVEDEETVRRFVSRSLSALGYTLLEAKDGAAALELGKRESSLDLLLTDVVMPNMNGGTLAEKLREIHPDLKAIFMSGYPDNVILPLRLPDRRVRFLQKPFGQARVANLVQEFLDEAKKDPGLAPDRNPGLARGA